MCVVCGTVWSGFVRVSLFCVWDSLKWVGGVRFCCVWEYLDLVWGSEYLLCVGQIGLCLGE